MLFEKGATREIILKKCTMESREIIKKKDF